MSTRSTYIEHGNVYESWQLAINAGCANTLTYDGDHDYSVGSRWQDHDWGYAEPAWTIPDTQAWHHGDGPLKELWGWIGTGYENHDAGAFLSANFLRGAWMFESTSANVSGQALTYGACAAICPTQEPLSIGVPEISGLMTYLLMGFSMEEACQMSCSYSVASSTEVWGDPFYTPFKRIKTTCVGPDMGLYW
jgi:hypothetical protein